MRLGDLRSVDLPAESVDLVFCDPPYTNDNIPLYADLSGFAARVLRPGGLCLAYSATKFLPAILGHAFMFFLSFNGGKAVATTAGVFLALVPAALIPAVTIFGIAVWISGHISVGSIVVAMVFPPITILVGASDLSVAFSFFACILILIKHISNVEKLMYSAEIVPGKRTTLEKS